MCPLRLFFNSEFGRRNYMPSPVVFNEEGEMRKEEWISENACAFLFLDILKLVKISGQIKE